MEKYPPIEKIAEAYTAVADNKVLMEDNQALVISSNSEKIYTVKFKDDIYSSNDNGTYWQHYAGYPIIAVLMKQNIIVTNKDIVDLFKDINWNQLNKKHKADYSAALAEITDEFDNKDEVMKEIENSYKQLRKLDIEIKRNKAKKEGFDSLYFQTISLRAKLQGLSEEKYRKFTLNLIPGAENVLGIRTPIIKKLAKDMLKKDNPIEYIRETDEIFYEEVLLKGFMITFMKTDLSNRLNLTTEHLSKINNWALCDSFCAAFKDAKKYQEEVWKFLIKFVKSDNTYEVRFAVVMMLDHYINEEYLSKLFEVFDRIDNDEYYVQMAVAWAVATCFTYYEAETMSYLKNNKLDDFTYNKALQKIRESLRVSKETKEIIKKMKRVK